MTFRHSSFIWTSLKLASKIRLHCLGVWNTYIIQSAFSPAPVHELVRVRQFRNVEKILRMLHKKLVLSLIRMSLLLGLGWTCLPLGNIPGSWSYSRESCWLCWESHESLPQKKDQELCHLRCQMAAFRNKSRIFTLHRREKGLQHHPLWLHWV